jgi:hypothetical protein
MMRRLLMLLLLVPFSLALGCATEETSPGRDLESIQHATTDSKDEAVSPIWIYPGSYDPDGRLYAAAGSRIISPDLSNHPCPWYMGGTSQNRIATSVHDELEARGVLLVQGSTPFYMVSVDLVGWSLADVTKVMDVLESHGYPRDHLVVSSTHTHEAPDTMGIWGPDFTQSGRCPQYVDFLIETIEDLYLELLANLVPVSAEIADTGVEDPDSNWLNLNRDSRYPIIVNDHLTTLRLFDELDQTVAIVVNWHSHPEVNIGAREYSSDFPYWIRLKMEEQFGGTCAYFSGTVGGLLTPLGVEVQARTEEGEPVLEQGEPVYLSNGSWEKTWSFGYVLAEFAIEAMENPEPLEPELVVNYETVRFPILHLFFALAMRVGILEFPEELLIRDFEECGLFGCFEQSLHHVRLGKLHLVSLPGEAFAESSVGRGESIKDWGEPYGEHVYEKIKGYREYLPEGHYLMDLGLANNEIGYIIPRSDYHWPDHPDFYEEWYTMSMQTERRMRQAIISMIKEYTGSLK